MGAVGGSGLEPPPMVGSGLEPPAPQEGFCPDGPGFAMGADGVGSAGFDCAGCGFGIWYLVRMSRRAATMFWSKGLACGVAAVG